MRRDAERFGLVHLPERRTAAAATQHSNRADAGADDTEDARDYDDGGNAAPAFSADDGPAWPDDAAEAAFLAENTRAGDAERAASREADTDDADDAGASLPTLETLMARIPRETREVLDELFRARFVAVRKIPRKVLKNGRD